MQGGQWYIRTRADSEALEAGAYWDEAKAQGIITFAERVFKSQFIAGQFRLLDWQTRFLKSLYGWRNKDGTRRFKTANLHISKKAGKTLLCSIICAFELLASGELSPFVVSGSVSKDNASQVWAEIRNTIEKAGLRKFCKVTPNLKRIQVPSLNAEYRALASDGDRAQGYNCSLVLL